MKKHENTPESKYSRTEEEVMPLGNKIARIAASDDDSIQVQWDEQPPRLARYLSSVPLKELIGSKNVGREVFINFVDNDPERPVITGLMANLIEEMMETKLAERDQQVAPEVIRDGKRVVIRAEEEITLICGSSSLTLTKDGRVLTKGTRIQSRASAMQEINGGRVKLN